MTERGRVKVESTQKRIRPMIGGFPAADSTNVLLVWEKPYYPTYYFPRADVTGELRASREGERSPSRGLAQIYDVAIGQRTVEAAAYRYPESPIEELRDRVAFRWRSMDAWFEEDEEVYVHARDPYTRVDILPSSRRVRVEIDGTEVADSASPVLLFETGLPVRYYLPRTNVRMDLLTPTDHRSRCPYKGTAEYWSMSVDGKTHENVAWSYPYPALESAKIAGLVCFYDERVDLWVDGVAQERPTTVFSSTG